MLYHVQSEYYIQFLTNKLRKIAAVDEDDKATHKDGKDGAKEDSKAKAADTKAWMSGVLNNK